LGPVRGPPRGGRHDTAPALPVFREGKGWGPGAPPYRHPVQRFAGSGVPPPGV